MKRRVLVAVAAFLVINVVFFLRDPFGIRGNVNAIGTSATATLLYAVPDPWGSGRFEALSGFDADRMNELRSGVGKRLLYVEPDRPSLSSAVVSVNPVDTFTWGGASLSKEGTCYLILMLHRPEDPRKVDVRFGLIENARSTCLGSQAKPGNVEERRWPD